MKTINVILGFDFGLKRIGVAVGQTVTHSARGLTVLQAQDGKANDNEIAQLIQQWQPDALLVGIPLNMDGTEQSITHRARQFANELEKKFNQTNTYMNMKRIIEQKNQQIRQLRQQLADENNDDDQQDED